MPRRNEPVKQLNVLPQSQESPGLRSISPEARRKHPVDLVQEENLVIPLLLDHLHHALANLFGGPDVAAWQPQMNVSVDLVGLIETLRNQPSQDSHRGQRLPLVLRSYNVVDHFYYFTLTPRVLPCHPTRCFAQNHSNHVIHGLTVISSKQNWYRLLISSPASEPTQEPVEEAAILLLSLLL
jgi:hypothetical protein